MATLAALASRSPPAGAGLSDIYERYEKALAGHLSRPEEATLAEAYELGREALGAGYGVVDLITLHQAALMSVLTGGRLIGSAQGSAAAAVGKFLLQAVSPFTALHINGRETISALRRLNQMLDGEAKRIANALHDDASQLLAAAYLELADIRHALPEPDRVRIDRLTATLDQAREQLRHLSHELRPPMLDQLGLQPAIKHLLEGFRVRNGLAVDLVFDSGGNRPGGAAELTLYRIVQEALTNVVRHSGSATAEVRIRIESARVEAEIVDHGRGMPADAGRDGLAGLGIESMRERANALNGSFAIASSSGKGTRISVSIPVGEQP